MLNLGSSVSSEKHSLQQFRFYGNNSRQQFRTNNDSAQAITLRTSQRSGSRVKSVGFGRHLITTKCVEDRMLTRRSLEQLKSSPTGNQAIETYNPDRQCSSIDSGDIKVAKKDKDCDILTTVSLNRNSVFDWLCTGRPSVGVGAQVNSSPSESCTWKGDELTKKPTLPLSCSDGLQKSPCSIESDSCNVHSAQINVPKTSPLSCSSSNTQLSNTSTKSKIKLRSSKLPRSLSFADCSKLSSWRRTSNLAMPESPSVSDVDSKEFPQDLPRSQSSATLTISVRPKRTVTMKKAESVSGLSWKEEVNLRRALMASMRSSGRSTGDEDSMDGKPHGQKRSSSQDRCCGNCYSVPVSTTPYFEDSNDGSSSIGTNKAYRGSHVRAQRKFAASPLSQSPARFITDSPITESSKQSPAVHKSNEGLATDHSMHRLVAHKLLKTEDFLTFLCIRGSPKLPPHLEVFSNDASSVVSSCPSTPTSSSFKTLLAHGGSDSDLGVSVLSLSHDTISYFYKLSGSNRCGPSDTTQLSGAGSVHGSQHALYSSWNRPMGGGVYALSPVPLPVMSTRLQPVKEAPAQKPDRTPSKSKNKAKLLTKYQLQLKGFKKQKLKQNTVPSKGTIKCRSAVKQLVRKTVKSSLISKANIVKKAAINTCTKSRLRASTQAVRTAVEREQQIMNELRAERSRDTKIRLGVKRCYVLKSSQEAVNCESKKMRLSVKGFTVKTLKPMEMGRCQNGRSLAAGGGHTEKKKMADVKMKRDGQPKVEGQQLNSSSSVELTERKNRIQTPKYLLKHKRWLGKSTPLKDELKKRTCQARITFKMAVKQKVAHKRALNGLSSLPENSTVKKNNLKSQKKSCNAIKNPDSLINKQRRDKGIDVSKSKDELSRIKNRSCTSLEAPSAESSPSNDGHHLDSVRSELAVKNKSRITVSETKCRKSLPFSISSLQSKPTISVNGKQLKSSEAPAGPANVVAAPTYYPTAEQFSDLIAYIELIKHDAAPFGMCRIIPPVNGWKIECNIPDSLRFVSHTQYIHRLKDRWGPNVCQTACIQQHTEKQASRPNDCAPLIGGIETDLANLLSAVEACGGLECVIDTNKWSDVVKLLHLPKAAREKTSRLYEIFCRYLLPYSTLSAKERQKLEGDLTSRKKAIRNPVVRKKMSTLSEFFCTARNVMSMYFDEDPATIEVERVYWEFVNTRKHHVAVQTACIEDTAGLQRCVSSSNLKKRSLHSLQRNSRSILHYLDRKITGVSLPVLNVSMLFSTRCWSVDKHFLPAIHYIHTGADVIWQCVPLDSQDEFKKAMAALVPESVNKHSDFWLNTDTAMVSPQDICRHGDVRISRVVQQQGELVVVFPQSMFSTVGCGYSVSEHVNYCPTDWLPLGCSASQMMYNCRQPELFSMDELLISIAQKDSAPVELLEAILPYLKKTIDRELCARAKLLDHGVLRAARWNAEKLSAMVDEEGNHRCHHSNQICYISLVVNESSGTVCCVNQALACLQRRKAVYQFRLFCRFTDKELSYMLSKVQVRINNVGDK